MEEINPQTPNLITEPVEVSNKNDGFLVSLLSVLLLISVFIAGFFAYQTQSLVKELNNIKDVALPTSISVTSPTPVLSNIPSSSSYPSSSPTGAACTLEAKVCSDGSSVGRTGLNCEFAACPTPKT